MNLKLNKLPYRIERHNLPPNPGNPVVKCWTYERIAPKYNYVRSNNPNFLWNIRNMPKQACWILNT